MVNIIIHKILFIIKINTTEINIIKIIFMDIKIIKINIILMDINIIKISIILMDISIIKLNQIIMDVQILLMKPIINKIINPCNKQRIKSEEDHLVLKTNKQIHQNNLIIALIFYKLFFLYLSIYHFVFSSIFFLDKSQKRIFFY